VANSGSLFTHSIILSSYHWFYSIIKEMKHILNFYTHATPEGNELKWVGTGKKGSEFNILVSTNQLDFETVHSIDVEPNETKTYEVIHESDAPETYYQIAYFVGKEEVEVSNVERIKKSQSFNVRLFVTRVIIAILLVAATMMIRKKLVGDKPEVFSKPFVATVPAAKVMDVKYTSFSTKIEALGQVISTQPIDIVSEVSGKIQKGNVVLRKARNFQKGDLLFTIDKQEAILNLKSQRSNFLNALVMMLPDLKLDFGTEFDKWNSYFQSINIDRSLATLPTINSQREKTFVATKNILGQYYSIKSAEERLQRYEVSAPYSGTITEVYTDAGSVANVGTKVIRVMRTNQLELELPIRKEDIQWIKVGSNVQLFSEDKRKSASGRVVRISNTLDPSTQSVNVYISINPRGMKLYQGMYLSAELSGRTVTNAAEISRRSVFDDNKIFVMNADSTLEQQSIKIHKVNTETLLFSGLNAGAKVVNDNLLGLAEGIKIKPIQ